jgi:leader peptidase (prepilin peptidase)/N-methyltransferase
MPAAALEFSLAALLAAVTITDLRSRLIPDAALIAATLAALALVGASDPGSLPARGLASAAAGAFLLAGALLRPGGMGLGDVKLAAVLGLYLGPWIVLALLVAFLAGSLAGGALLVLHGWGARSRTIPFAPFLALGGLAAMAVAQP